MKKKENVEITLAEAAEILGVAIPTIKAWLVSGKMRGRKRFGTRWVVAMEEVKKWEKLK